MWKQIEWEGSCSRKPEKGTSQSGNPAGSLSGNASWHSTSTFKWSSGTKGHHKQMIIVMERQGLKDGGGDNLSSCTGREREVNGVVRVFSD